MFFRSLEKHTKHAHCNRERERGREGERRRERGRERERKGKREEEGERKREREKERERKRERGWEGEIHVPRVKGSTKFRQCLRKTLELPLFPNL